MNDSEANENKENFLRLNSNKDQIEDIRELIYALNSI